MLCMPESMCNRAIEVADTEGTVLCLSSGDDSELAGIRSVASVSLGILIMSAIAILNIWTKNKYSRKLRKSN